MVRQFEVLLTDIVSHSQKKISELQLLTHEDEQLLLHDWNDTQTDYARESCLHQLFEAQVERASGAALVFQDRQYTYAEVNRRANQLAHYLKKLGVGAEVCVGICMQRSAEMVISLLGVLKAGGAYLPLDPSYPPDRLRFMLSDSQTRVVLTQDGMLPDLAEDVHRVSLDSSWLRFAGESEENPACETAAENLAYVIYTSGSTGLPKGVMISHRNLVNFCAGIDQSLAPEDGATWLAVTSISFDISALELLWTLTRGFKVVIQNEAETTPASSERPGTIPTNRKIDFTLFYIASEESAAPEER
jgi:non-ribosomal peptide synthetase component F